DMPGKRGAIDEKSVTANLAIVTDMRIREEKIVVAEFCGAAAFAGAAADGYVFAEDIAISGKEISAFTAKGVVLRFAADAAKRMKNIFAPEFCRPLKYRVGMNNATFAYFHEIGRAS